MNKTLKTALGLRTCRLAVLLALVAPAACVGQAFNNSSSVADPLLTTITASLDPATVGSFYRISNLYGIGGLQVAPNDIQQVTEPDPSIFAGANERYLNRLGQFTFANDYPITEITLDMTAHSIYAPNGDLLGFNARSAFLLHDFSLLFVGQNGAEFLISRLTPLIGGGTRPSADEDFILSMGSGDRIPNLQYQSVVPATTVPPGRQQITSLEWLTAGLPNGDPAVWDPGADPFTYEDDTFPTNADVVANATDVPNFQLVRPNSGQPLYAAGGGETTWNVYLFSTGPLSGADAQQNPAPIQLNFSQITITVTGLPESTHALWGGLVLLGMAEILRRRKNA